MNEARSPSSNDHCDNTHRTIARAFIHRKGLRHHGSDEHSYLWRHVNTDHDDVCCAGFPMLVA